MTVTAAREAKAAPLVEVSWVQLAERPGGDSAEQVARDVVALVIGHVQRKLSASPALVPVVADQSWQTVQSVTPIAHSELAGRVAGIQLVGDGDLRLLRDNGDVVELRSGRNQRARSSLDGMDVRPKHRRKPPRVMLRPGKGGFQFRSYGDTDPTEGLGQYITEFGEIIWQPAPGGATIGVLEMYEHGNTVLVQRLSSEDRNETLVPQFATNLALTKQHPEILIPRRALFAVNMSGTREVRPDRSGAPPPGVLERDDMLILDQWLREGWVESIVARDDDRIARTVLANETLRARWKKYGVDLWLARLGKKMDFDTDQLALGALALVSASERTHITARLQGARIDKGPLIGLGWGTRPRLGFVIDESSGAWVEDEEQWPFILMIFELADVGDADALATRKIAETVSERGFEISNDRVRTILRDEIYATGEWYANVRGIAVQQKTIQLRWPVPIDRFLRVNELLNLRQGRSNNTPIGEFLLNYVEAVHAQCSDIRRERNGKEEGALIKGYIDKRQPNVRRMFHHPFVPECCKGNGRGWCGGHSWERDWLEPPMIDALRELATDPVLLQQLALAARHDIATSTSHLSAAQRAELEAELERLARAAEIATEKYVDEVVAGREPDVAAHDLRIKSLNRRVSAIQARLDASDDTEAADGPEHERRVADFLEIMTRETPEDPFLRQLRARIFQRIVERVEIDDPGEGPIRITMYGHLVPKTEPLGAANPIHAAGDLLDSYADVKVGSVEVGEVVEYSKPGATSERRAKGDVRSSPETDLAKVNGKSVWEEYPRLLDRPGHLERIAVRRSRITDIAWHQRRQPTRGDVNSWIRTVEFNVGTQT